MADQNTTGSAQGETILKHLRTPTGSGLTLDQVRQKRSDNHPPLALGTSVISLPPHPAQSAGDQHAAVPAATPFKGHRSAAAENDKEIETYHTRFIDSSIHRIYFASLAIFPLLRPTDRYLGLTLIHCGESVPKPIINSVCRGPRSGNLRSVCTIYRFFEASYLLSVCSFCAIHPFFDAS